MADTKFPAAAWTVLDSPADAGWSVEALDGARRFSESIQTAALMVVEGGRVVAQWGDVARRYKCHSIRKSLLSALYGLHLESGAIDLAKTLAVREASHQTYSLRITAATPSSRRRSGRACRAC